MDNQQEIAENKREKQENKKYLLIIFLLLISISIGFGALSSTLRIKDKGIITPKWDVHFENISDKSNKATIVEPATILGGSTNIEYAVNLNEMGSYYEFEVDVKNDGNINAILTTNSFIFGISSDQIAYTNYKVQYVDGTPLRYGDILRQGESKRILVRIEIPKNLEEYQLPKTRQTLNLYVDLNYVQA